MSSRSRPSVSAAVAFGFVAALSGAAPAMPNPIAHWKLDEPSGTTAVDETGNHNGTNNGATINQPGKIDTAYSFDGVDDYVEVPDSLELRFTSSDSWSISAWVYLESDPGGWRGLVVKSRGTSPWYGLWTNAGSWCIGGTNLTGSAVTLGEWHHVVGVQDGGAGTQTLYVDNVVDATGGAANGDGAGVLWLGGAETTSEFMHGKLDDVRIYNAALSAADVQDLYNQAMGDYPPQITSTPPVATVVGAVYSYTVTATGNPVPTYRNDTVTMPGWLSWDGTDTFSGTPDVTDVGQTGDITAAATNGISPDDTQVFRITVVAGDPDLRGHWKLDNEGAVDEAIDSSAFGNDGTLNGFPGDGSEWVTGNVDGALEFDGGDDHVDVPADASLSVTSMTLAAWVYFPSTIPSGWLTVVEHDRMSANWYGLWKHQTDPVFHFRWSYTGNQSMDFATTISPDTWYHVAGTFDATTGEACVYLKGVLDGTESGASGTAVTAALRIGRNMADGEPFPGIIDDVRVYSRALSAAEVEGILRIVTIEAIDAAASEQGPDAGSLRISRTGSTASSLSVNIDITDGTADAADYVSNPDISGGTVVIPADSDHVDITITPVPDTDYGEPDETVVVTIADGGTEYTVGAPSTETVTIANYVPPPPGAFVLTWPADGASALTDEPVLRWGTSSDAETYTVTIYSDASMSVEVDSANVTAPATSYAVPAATLAWDTQYWWKVTAQNVIDTTEGSNNGISFYTTPIGAPTVQSISPSDGESDVDVGADIRIVFNEPLNPTTVVAGCVTLNDGLIDINGTVSLVGDRTVVFDADDDLAEETVYTITVAATPADRVGNAFAGGTYRFTTQLPLTGLASGKGCVPGCVAWPEGLGLVLAGAVALACLRRRRGSPSSAGAYRRRHSSPSPSSFSLSADPRRTSCLSSSFCSSRRSRSP